MIFTLLYPYIPVRRLVTGTTECILIYYFSTGGSNPHDKEKCNPAPLKAYFCIERQVKMVSISNRNTTNKLKAISFGRG
jgi:hypothetical protein